jgi:hypothetical protein
MGPQRRHRSSEPHAEPDALAVQPARSPVADVLALQRSAGNAAVTRMLTPAGRPTLGRNGPTTATPTFTNADIQAVWDANKDKATPEQQASLEQLDKSQTGVWKHLSWSAIAASTARRVFNPSLINQDVLGVCGPAAVLNGTAGRDPKGYVDLVISIFVTGKAAGSDTKTKLRDNEPPTTMDPCDWMVLSSMQTVTNTFLDFTGKPDDDSAMGTGPGEQKWMLEKFGGAVNTTVYSCEWWGVEDQTKKVSDLLTKHGKDVTVLMSVASNLIDDEDAKENPRDHAIRLLAPVTWTDAEVVAQVYTWGSTRTLKMKPKNYERFVFRYTVGAHKKDISL